MKIKLIPDEIIKLNNENDLLGTKPYSNTIFELISNSTGRKNIGLFGSWGSGKSSILSTLEDLITNHNESEKKGKKINKDKKIGYFEFDAWKYSKDDFRRSFIIELNSKFNIKPTSILKKTLYSETSVEDPNLSKLGISWLALPNWIIFLLVLFSFVVFFSPILEEKQDIKGLISFFTLLVTLLITAANKTITKYKVVVKDSKIIEPERFENIFDEIITAITLKKDTGTLLPKWIKNLLIKPKFDKVVIVIDNLDRCDDENLLTTMNTIKNFLEHKKVIFILPVDEKSISSFLSQKTDNAGEYLRKIFHIIIRLKTSSKKELLEFTKKLNTNYQLGLDSSSIRFICQEFTNNPRKIIQFLNNYQSEMSLVHEQSSLGYINGDYIKENISFFVKLQIIKSEWKELYSEILYDKTLLNKINDDITSLKPDENNFYQINKSRVKLNDSQRNFFYTTQNSHCTKIDSFLLNIDLDKDIPDEIEDYIRYADYDNIVNYLENAKIELNEAKLLKKINEVYSNLTHKHRDYLFIALPVFSLLMKFVLSKNQKKFKKEIKDNYKEYNFLTDLFKNKAISQFFHKLDFKEICLTVKWFSENINDDLYNSFIKHLKNNMLAVGTENNDEINQIEIFLKVFSDTDKLSDIKTLFSLKIIAKPSLFEIGLLSDYSISSKIISNQSFKKISDKLKEEDLDYKIKAKISNLIVKYLENNETDSKTRVELIQYYFKILLDFYEEYSIDYDVLIDYDSLFKQISKVLNRATNITLTESFKEMITEVNAFLFDNYDNDFDEDKYSDSYENFFEVVKNLIFHTKDFNKISYRTEYFGNYLEEDVSDKINLKINEILFEDINEHSAYNYPFSKELIAIYKNPRSKIKFSISKTLMLMLEKSTTSDGLSESEIIEIIERSVNIFCFYPDDIRSQNNLKFIKKHRKSLFIDSLNKKPDGTYLKFYIENVKSLNDKWFYGNTIQNYLDWPLVNSKGTYQNFIKRLREVSEIFSIEEQTVFLEDLLNAHQEFKIYKWLRLSHNFLNKKVYDIYLEHLIYAHKNKFVNHNNFFEWISNIPTNIFYKKRLTEYTNYLTELNITHKTYKPKKENALSHLLKN